MARHCGVHLIISVLFPRVVVEETFHLLLWDLFFVRCRTKQKNFNVSLVGYEYYFSGMANWSFALSCYGRFELFDFKRLRRAYFTVSPRIWNCLFKNHKSFNCKFDHSNEIELHCLFFQVAHMSRSPLNGWDTSFVGPLAVCINQYFNLLIDEHVFLWLFLVRETSCSMFWKISLSFHLLGLRFIRSSSI